MVIKTIINKTLVITKLKINDVTTPSLFNERNTKRYDHIYDK